MSLHVHRLHGCAPAPLAHYLKALGILRLVGEQADPEARGAWQGETFLLATRLDRKELEAFFLGRYQPTPLVAPWNKGCGFFMKDDPGLSPLERSKALRFRVFRQGVKAARDLSSRLADADDAVRIIKTEAKEIKNTAARKRLRESPEYKRRLAEADRLFKSRKEELIPLCRMNWRGPHREWMDAAITVVDAIEDKEGNVKYPALLGTGGNDGRLDFTNNFMQRLGDLFDLAHADGIARTNSLRWLDAALWGAAVGKLRNGAAIGQYFPGNAGGANSTTGPDGDSLLNPWEFVLMMEGAVLFTAHVSRRMTSGDVVQASAPFAVRSHAAGNASASAVEESERGEQWMPLWDRFVSLGELRRLLSEGRAQIGTRSAQRPIELAKAVARLGVARGLTGFQRFGYLERNGQSNLAVPLGRIEVRERPHARLIDDIEPWLNRLHREARAKHAPARLVAVERRLADTVFAAITHDDEPARWQAVLLAMAEVEAVQAAGTGFAAGPIPRLSPEWAFAAQDDTPEFRLALALGGAYSKEGRLFDSVRRHWLPLDQNMRKYSTSGKRLLKDARVVVHGRDAGADLLAVVSRRLVESGRGARRRLPIVAASGAAARLGDLAALIAGRVDLDRVFGLARAFMALDWAGWTRQIDAARNIASRDDNRSEMPDDAWLALRLALLPWPLEKNGRAIPADPAIVRRLEAGEGGEAVDLALRRLRAAGICSTINAALVDPARARLWGAALAFPITRGAARRAARHIDPAFAGKE